MANPVSFGMKDFLLKRLINDKKDNIQKVSIPFGILAGDNGTENNERRMVVFLGDNFRDLSGTDLKEATRISNLCLNYVRRQCAGFDLCYKPHPRAHSTGADEADLLDLSGFKIEDATVAELFYLKNIEKIKYVFAACSMGSVTAYDMGLNSYTFLNIISAAFDPETRKGKNKVLKDMPPEFFIDSFEQPLKENKKKFNDDGALEKCIRDVFFQKRGRVWLFLGGTADLANAAAITMLIKKINPGRAVDLIIVMHNRWSVVPMDDIRGYFDNIFTLPRIFYSLRPVKIFRAIKTARTIKKFPIQPNDIILEIQGLGFAADCFTSYFPKSTRVAIISGEVFDISCEEQRYSRDIFRTRPGATFFNLILEPILGIERTQWLEDRRRIYNVDRYVRPINDIFDYVWKF